MSEVAVTSRDEGLRAELEKREKELAAVLKISNALSSKVQLDELVRETLEVSLDTVGANAGSVLLHDPKQDRLVFRYVLNTDNPEVARTLAGMAIPKDKGYAGQVFQSGEPLITDDPTQSTRHLREIGERVGYITRNMLTVPLKSMEGEPIGVMQALNKRDGNFDEDDRDLLTIMAQHAASAIENAHLHEEAKRAVVLNLMGDISHDIKNLITPAQTGTQTLELLLQDFFQNLDRLCAERRGDHGDLVTGLERAASVLREMYPEMISLVIESSNATQERVREIADCVKGIIAEPAFEPSSVSEVILSVVKPLKAVAQRKGVEIQTEGLSDLPPILIDRKRLYNAIYNLVNNAIPETPKGGRIALRTYAVPEGTFPDGNYLMIEVADTGRGMPEEVRNRLFTDDAISTKPGGTGLGTRIVKNVVDAHEGKITVESEQDKGTTFYMKLPFRTAAAGDPTNGKQ